MKETMLDLELLPAMAVFVRVAEERSFTAAAQGLGVSRSAVSKQLSKLERALGLRLLNRTTRAIAITEAGASIFQHCQEILKQSEEIRARASEQSASPHGTLRISAPTSFGPPFVAPCLGALAAKNPQLKVRLSLDDRIVNLIDEGFDLAVRIASMPDSELVATRIAEIQILACASPSYLEQRGEPARPNELKDHSCLTYDHAKSSGAWAFPAIDPELSIQVKGPFHCNNGEALCEAAKSGLGVVLLPEFLVAEAIARGQLRPLFGGRACSRLPLQVVTPHRGQQPQSVRAFIQAFTALMREPPWRARGAQRAPGV